MTFKQRIYDHYLQLINDKISLLRNTLNDLKESSSNETKSTAGDKHETALAMLQIEQKNVSRQLKEALDQKILYGQINSTLIKTEVSSGALLKTNKGYLFLSIALGKILVDGITIMAISPQSPLGQKLMGLKINDTVEINSIGYVIESIS
ncbi:MAG: hypothetical protein ABI675_13680 [Chitinophagaceae bacterium]